MTLAEYEKGWDRLEADALAAWTAASESSRALKLAWGQQNALVLLAVVAGKEPPSSPSSLKEVRKALGKEYRATEWYWRVRDARCLYLDPVLWRLGVDK